MGRGGEGVRERRDERGMGEGVRKGGGRNRDMTAISC